MPLPNEGEEHRAEALKLMQQEPTESTEEVKPEGQEEPPPPADDIDAIEKKLAAEGEKQQESDKVEEPVKQEEPAPLKDRFGALVREKAQLRKREQQLADMERRLAPMLKAIEDGDVMGLMSTAGFNHQQYVSQLVEGKKAQPTSGRQEAPSALEAEVRQLKEMLMQQQAANFRTGLLSQTRELATKKAQSLPFVNAKGAAAEAVDFVEKYYAEVGELPGKTMEDSLELALEAIESQYAAQAKEWEGLLTKVKKPAQTSSETAKSREEAVEKTGSKTLSAGMSAPTKKVDDDETTDVAALRARARAMLFNK